MGGKDVSLSVIFPFAHSLISASSNLVLMPLSEWPPFHGNYSQDRATGSNISEPQNVTGERGDKVPLIYTQERLSSSVTLRVSMALKLRRRNAAVKPSTLSLDRCGCSS